MAPKVTPSSDPPHPDALWSNRLKRWRYPAPRLWAALTGAQTEEIALALKEGEDAWGFRPLTPPSSQEKTSPLPERGPQGVSGSLLPPLSSQTLSQVAESPTPATWLFSQTVHPAPWRRHTLRLLYRHDPTVLGDGAQWLRDALALGDKFLVAWLIERAGCPWPPSLPGQPTVLHHACASGNPALVRYVLRTHASLLHAEDESGRTPLHWAVRAESSRVYKLLSEAGASWHHPDRVRKRTPLEELRLRHPHQASYWWSRPTITVLEKALAPLPPPPRRVRV